MSLSDLELITKLKERHVVIEIRADFTSENKIGYINGVPFKIVVKS